MLKHRSTWPVFAIAHVLALLGLVLGWWNAIPLASTIVLHVARLSWGSFSPRAGFFITHRNSTTNGALALTYDDGPHPQLTPLLLDLLREEQVTATFFCIGRAVENDPLIAKRIVQEGHAIGIHTMNHHWSWGFTSKQQAKAEIMDGAQAIERATGTRTTLFRPPFGVTSPHTAHAIESSGTTAIAWDLRTFDTTSKNTTALIQRTLARLDEATIVVMHDTAPSVIEHTRAVIHAAKAKGRSFIKLSALLLAGLFLMSSGASAQDGRTAITKDDPLVKALMEKGKAITTLQATFVQEKHLKVLKEPMISNGQFYYHQPGRLRWQIDGPTAMTAVVESKNVRIMEGGKERVVSAQDKEVYTAISEMISGIVTGRLLSNGSMKVSYYRTANGLLVDLIPTDQRIAKRLKAIQLLFNEKDMLLRELRMDQANGDHTITRFSNAKSGMALPENVFNLP